MEGSLRVDTPRNEIERAVKSTAVSSGVFSFPLFYYNSIEHHVSSRTRTYEDKHFSPITVLRRSVAARLDLYEHYALFYAEELDYFPLPEGI